jgi:ppGpp synthetase/RelA/SpoT-type nucleotidyltranferase
MKIPASIRQIYEDQRDLNIRLKEVVDRRMRGLAKSGWHYVSRIKELTSFALKIETGRFSNPQALEDMFACTIVVTNATELDEAERLIGDNFAIKKRRPQHQNQTHKAPDSFPFDDLRIYAFIPDSPTEPPTDLIGVVFEVQIKTFLQHAWTIATHDLVYKTDSANWSKERLAYQIKAMLEHAEMAIQEAETLAQSGALAKQDPRTEAIKAGIALIKSQWTQDELPQDVRLLATNISNLVEALRLKGGRLEQILNEGKAARSGNHPTNLSPYATVVQYLFISEREKMISLLRDRAGKTKILIPEEIELPADIDRTEFRNAVFVKRGRIEKVASSAASAGAPRIGEDTWPSPS